MNDIKNGQEVETEATKAPTISPEVWAELERLGVSDLPWEDTGFNNASLRVWNHHYIFQHNPATNSNWLSVGYNGKYRDYKGVDLAEWVQLARARYSPQEPIEKKRLTQQEILDDLKPSNVSWSVEQLKELEMLPRSVACAVNVEVMTALERQDPNYEVVLQRIRTLVEPSLNPPMEATKIEEAAKADEERRERLGTALETLRERWSQGLPLNIDERSKVIDLLEDCLS